MKNANNSRTVNCTFTKIDMQVISKVLVKLQNRKKLYSKIFNDKKKDKKYVTKVKLNTIVERVIMKILHKINRVIICVTKNK